MLVRLDVLRGSARARQTTPSLRRQALHEEFTEGLELKASADVPSLGLQADLLDIS